MKRRTMGIASSSGLAPHLPAPAGFDDWHWATSLNQARAVAFAIERWRPVDPPCRGMIVWQLNDCWPAVSWAAVDGDGRRKPLWYALRQVFADRLVTFQPLDEGGTELVAINDGPATWSGTIELTPSGFPGACAGDSHGTACRASRGEGSRAPRRGSCHARRPPPRGARRRG